MTRKEEEEKKKKGEGGVAATRDLPQGIQAISEKGCCTD